MKHFLAEHKRLLTAILALVGIGVTVAYALCFGVCSSLKGDLLGIDLKYLGISYMSVILVLALMRKSLYRLLLLAFGAGGEVILIGYQVRTGVYCPFCLALAATIFLALFVNLEQTRKWLVALAAVAGLAVFLLLFSGSALPTLDTVADPTVDSVVEPVPDTSLPIPAYGTGPVEVRIYTDYFCEPCYAQEAEVMALVSELVDKNRIQVILIDTPVHKETAVFAVCFLSALNASEDKGLRRTIALREALFEAAAEKITEKAALELFMKERGFAVRPFDPAPVFRIFSDYMLEDQVKETPSCVIVDSQGKKTLAGDDEIIQALRDLLARPSSAQPPGMR